jgi:type IV pilus assembly protein PilF
MALSNNRFLLAICLPIFLLVSGCMTEETRTNGEPVESKVSDEGALKDYTALAVGYMKEGKRELALRAINNGLEIDDDYPELLNVLALYYSSDGESELAEKQYKKALRSDSSYTATYLNYGKFLFQKERYDESCSMFKKATEDVMYPKRDGAFYNYGLCLKKQGKTKEAEDALRRSYVNDPRNWQVVLELSLLKFESGDFEESLQWYNKFLTMSRQTAKSTWLGVRLMHVTGDEDKMAGYALYLKNQFPSSQEYRDYKAWSESK